MFVELLGMLRCPNAHEDSPLVATASSTVDRHIVEGTLGCPVCHAEYRVRHGAVEFGGQARAAAATREPPSHEHTMRLAALLGLDERGGIYVLDFASACHLRGLAGLSPASRFIAMSDGDDAGDAAVFIRGRGSVLPLAKACARGIVLDDSTHGLVRSAVSALAPGGRLVAPADADVPPGIELLARDAEQWVGERLATPALSAIRRAPR